MRAEAVSRAGTKIIRAVAVLSAAVTLVPAVANANPSWWKNGALGIHATDADVTRTALTSSGASADSSNHKIDAGAHYAGSWLLYASYAEAWGQACHNYGGENIGAMVWNPHSVEQDPVLAIAGWVGDQGATYC